MTIIWKSSFDKLPTLITSDHPLSLGYELKFLCNDEGLPHDFRAPKNALEEFQEQIDDETRGMYVSWSQNRKDIIYVNVFDGDDIVPLSRKVGLIAHEVSHFVDAMLQRTGMSEIDTELRAYHIDWIVEKALQLFERAIDEKVIEARDMVSARTRQCSAMPSFLNNRFIPGYPMVPAAFDAPREEHSDEKPTVEAGKHISALDLPRDTEIILRRAAVLTVRQLAALTPLELVELPRMGRMLFEDIKLRLALNDLKLAPQRAPIPKGKARRTTVPAKYINNEPDLSRELLPKHLRKKGGTE